MGLRGATSRHSALENAVAAGRASRQEGHGGDDEDTVTGQKHAAQRPVPGRGGSDGSPKQLEIARQPDGTYDFHPQFAMIAEALKDADYTIANLETTIGQFRDVPCSGFPRFNTPEALLDALRDAGVDFLSLANNHILDRFFEGLVKTVDRVEAWGFDYGGANRTPEEKDRPVVVTVNDIRVGMLCYTELTNAMDDYFSPEAEAYGVNYMCRADYAADVQRLRDAGAEVVLAMPHWGEEYWRRPEPNTVEQAKRLVAAGGPGTARSEGGWWHTAWAISSATCACSIPIPALRWISPCASARRAALRWRMCGPCPSIAGGATT